MKKQFVFLGGILIFLTFILSVSYDAIAVAWGVEENVKIEVIQWLLGVSGVVLLGYGLLSSPRRGRWG